MALIVWAQQKANVKILADKLAEKGINRNSATALIVNSLHESYCNPMTIQGSVNPGPPATKNGAGPAAGLWQWEHWQQKIKLGDWDQQINFMIKDSSQYVNPSRWFAINGVSDPLHNGMSWADWLANKPKASARDLTINFIGSWERPGMPHARVASAQADCDEVYPYTHDGKGGGSDPGGGGGNGGNSDNGNKLSAEALAAVKMALDKIKEALKFDVHNISNANKDYLVNSILLLYRTYDNTYHAKLKQTWIDNMLKSLSPDNGNNGGNDGGGGNPPSSGGWQSPRKTYTAGFPTGANFGYGQDEQRPNGFHDGIDYMTRDTNLCAHDGKVIFIGTSGSTQHDIGDYVVIDCQNGKKMIYQEFSFSDLANTVKVKVGEQVKKGQVICTAGRGGTHLHFGICDASKNPIWNHPPSWGAYTPQGWFNPLEVLAGKHGN